MTTRCQLSQVTHRFGIMDERAAHQHEANLEHFCLQQDAPDGLVPPAPGTPGVEARGDDARDYPAGADASIAPNPLDVNAVPAAE